MRNVRRPILTAARGFTLMELLVVLAAFTLAFAVAPIIANRLGDYTPMFCQLSIIVMGFSVIAWCEIERKRPPLRDVVIGALLVLGCLACIVSIVRTIETMPQSARDCLAAGRLDIGWFEAPIQPVRLTDLSTAHDHCGPTCPMKSKEVGR